MTLPTRKFLILTISNTLLISAALILVLTWTPVLLPEIQYQWRKLIGQNECLAKSAVGDAKCQNQAPKSAFGSLIGRLVNASDVTLLPPNKSFSIVIEKIGVAAPIVTDVSVVSPEAYNEALKGGVAQAEGTAVPSDPRGNVYLFAHSSLNFWQLGKYATVFNLLRKLEVGDPVHVFYLGKDYAYMVISSEVVPGFNTYPLERRVIEPILTLQTCDPPGTTLNRLVVTAKLVKIV